MIARKGISPLIATVLLIAFTIAVAGIISVWITSFTRSQADTQTTKGNTATTCAGDALFFAQSDVNVSAGTIKVVVANEGNVNITSLGVYASYKSGTFYSNVTPAGTPTSASPLQPGQKVQLSANSGDATLTTINNLSTITVTIGNGDTCAGRSYPLTVI